MRTSSFVAPCVVAVAWSTSALANGRFPQSNQIVFSQKDPNIVVARATYAILPSHDNGNSWWYLCEDVLGLPSMGVQDPELAFTAGGSLVAGTSAPVGGLNVSQDVGCNWTCVTGALFGQAIADVVVRPDSPHTVLALTGTSLPSDAGLAQSYSQIFQSTDDGTTWTAMGKAIDPTWTVETIDVSKSDSMRIYVSAWRGYNNGRTAALLVSKDGAQSWEEHDITGFDNLAEDRVWIGAVDPADADRVYLRSNTPLEGGESRLYLTTDAGMTFTTPKVFPLDAAKPSYVIAEFLGFALSPDGSKVYVGSSQGGLFVADRESMMFHQTATGDFHCLASRTGPSGATELWACGDASFSINGAPGFLVGVSTDDGAHFTSKLPLVSALCGPTQCASTGTLGCNASFNGSGCGDSYTMFCANDVSMACGTCPGSERAGKSSSSSSCALSSGGGGSMVAATILAGLAAIGGRRRRLTASARTENRRS